MLDQKLRLCILFFFSYRKNEVTEGKATVATIYLFTINDPALVSVFLFEHSTLPFSLYLSRISLACVPIFYPDIDRPSSTRRRVSRVSPLCSIILRSRYHSSYVVEKSLIESQTMEKTNAVEKRNLLRGKEQTFKRGNERARGCEQCVFFFIYIYIYIYFVSFIKRLYLIFAKFISNL